MKIYLIGSLRNSNIPEIANKIRDHGFEVFDDWFAPGPQADEFWRSYEIQRGRNYLEALQGHAAQHIYEFDKSHIDSSDVGIMALPCGRSGHLELGYFIGHGKPGYILLEEPNPERFDVMYQFATGLYGDLDSLISALKEKRDEQKG